MKFYFIKDVPSEAHDNDEVIYSINQYEYNITDLISDLEQEHKEEIIRNLNSINNQGITDIIFQTGIYYIGNKKLKFKDLCTAERVFLIATAAKILKRTVYLCNDITQLTRTTFKTFLKLFYECEHINIIYTHTSEPYEFKDLLNQIGYDLDLSCIDDVVILK